MARLIMSVEIPFRTPGSSTQDNSSDYDSRSDSSMTMTPFQAPARTPAATHSQTGSRMPISAPVVGATIVRRQAAVKASGEIGKIADTERQWRQEAKGGSGMTFPVPSGSRSLIGRPAAPSAVQFDGIRFATQAEILGTQAILCLGDGNSEHKKDRRNAGRSSTTRRSSSKATTHAADAPRDSPTPSTLAWNALPIERAAVSWRLAYPVLWRE